MAEVPAGFSAEAWAVVQRKPQARILDCTAGNRHIWGKNKMRDDVIFTDKEPRLKIPPDLLCEWRDLPKHFPADYFHCAIFDPPHLIRFDADMERCKWIHKYPAEDGEHGASWWGFFKTKRSLSSEIIIAQRSLSIISNRLCLKWCDNDIPIERILSIFIDWRPQFETVAPSKGLRGKDGHLNRTWWVKLVRKSG